MMKIHLNQVAAKSSRMSPIEAPAKVSWLNTQDDAPWSFQNELKGKFVVIDFWSSCCINCIHVLAEMDRLEHLFSNFPEVAFVGCHSAKFENEKDFPRASRRELLHCHMVTGM